jgi:hypothetical protein
VTIQVQLAACRPQQKGPRLYAVATARQAGDAHSRPLKYPGVVADTGGSTPSHARHIGQRVQSTEASSTDLRLRQPLSLTFLSDEVVGWGPRDCHSAMRALHEADSLRLVTRNDLVPVHPQTGAQ